MSTKFSIAYVNTDGELVHIYTDCFDEPPCPVYIELGAHGENANHEMTLRIPQAKALQLADEMTKWAASTRAWAEKGGES